MPDLFLISHLIPVPHGFSVRHGGVSEGPYASLNLGYSVGDDPARVTENLRRLARKAGLPASALATISQVHGDRVLRAEAMPEGDEPLPPIGEADALWTDAPGVAVGVKTADCVPILISDREGRRVAAVHSGWRGTELKIAARAVETLVENGARADQLVAAVGPCIQACCYEVSEDLASRFGAAFGEEVIERSGSKPHLDLSRAVRQTLREAGLSDERIDVLPHCTACDATKFFSHRRDRGQSGRQLSFVVSAATGL